MLLRHLRKGREGPRLKLQALPQEPLPGRSRDGGVALSCSAMEVS